MKKMNNKNVDEINLEYSPLLNAESCFFNHFFTTKFGGVSNGNYCSLNLSEYVGDDFENVSENRRILCEYLGIPQKNLIVPHEVHGDKIVIVDNDFLENNGNNSFDCDALITTIPKICVSVTTADCVPIIIMDIKKRVVAAVHAGWRGLASEIIKKTIDVLSSKYDSSLNDLRIAIGPCISLEKYEVGNDLIKVFENLFFKADFNCIYKIIEDKPHLNLRECAFLQLRNKGVEEKNIWIHPDCTFCNEKYFSARRQSVHSGRILSGIFIR